MVIGKWDQLEPSRPVAKWMRTRWWRRHTRAVLTVLGVVLVLGAPSVVGWYLPRTIGAQLIDGRVYVFSVCRGKVTVKLMEGFYETRQPDRE